MVIHSKCPQQQPRKARRSLKPRNSTPTATCGKRSTPKAQKRSNVGTHTPKTSTKSSRQPPRVRRAPPTTRTHQMARWQQSSSTATRYSRMSTRRMVDWLGLCLATERYRRSSSTPTTMVARQQRRSQTAPYYPRLPYIRRLDAYYRAQSMGRRDRQRSRTRIT